MEKYCRFLFAALLAFTVLGTTAGAQTHYGNYPNKGYANYGAMTVSGEGQPQKYDASQGPAHDYNYQFYNHRDENGRVLFPKLRVAAKTTPPPVASMEKPPEADEKAVADEQYQQQYQDMVRRHVHRTDNGFRPVGASIPNMIGDSTSMPTKLLTYSFMTTKEVSVPNPNYVAWPEEIHTDVPKGSGLTDNGAGPSGPANPGNPGNGLNVNDDLLEFYPGGVSAEKTDSDDDPLQKSKPSRDKYIVTSEAVRETIAVPMPVTPTMFVTMLNIAENFNAEVQDRFYIDLRYLGGGESYGVAKDTGGVFTSRTDMSRMTFGIEKKIADRHSVELRLPVVLSGLKSSQTIVGSGKAAHSSEFGNLSIVYKNAWRRTPQAVFCWGIGINTPTAPNMKLKYQPVGGADMISGTVENRKVGLVPYVGFEWNRDDMSFGHLIAQADVALGENRMTFTDQRYGQTSYKADLKEYSLFRLNIGTGRWLYQNPVDAALFRLGAMAEFHFTTNIDVIDSKAVYSTGAGSDSYFVAAPRKRNWANVDLVFGLPIHTRRTTLTTFVGVPLTNTRYHNIEGGLSADIRF